MSLCIYIYILDNAHTHNHNMYIYIYILSIKIYRAHDSYLHIEPFTVVSSKKKEG